MRMIDNIPYTEPNDAERVIKLWLPEAESFPVFVYFHGGGLVKGTRHSGDFLAEWLTSHGVALASVEYRMYPDARYPAFIEDCAAAVAWIFQHVGEYGKCEGVYVGGSSAGGYLSMMLCFDGRWLAPYGLVPTDISGFLHDAGQPTCHFNVLANDGGVDSRRVIVDETSPLWHIGTAERYPRMHFVVSDNDMEGRYEQTMLVLATLKHFGYEGFSHSVLHGTHCHYCNTKRGIDENGDLILGKMILDLMHD